VRVSAVARAEGSDMPSVTICSQWSAGSQLRRPIRVTMHQPQDLAGRRSATGWKVAMPVALVEHALRQHGNVPSFAVMREVFEPILLSVPRAPASRVLSARSGADLSVWQRPDRGREGKRCADVLTVASPALALAVANGIADAGEVCRPLRQSLPTRDARGRQRVGATK